MPRWPDGVPTCNGPGGIADVTEGSGHYIGDVEMIPVAAPQHPLARNPPKLVGQARQYRQLVLTVRSSFSQGQDVGVFGGETWRLADLGAKHALLLAADGVLCQSRSSARILRQPDWCSLISLRCAAASTLCKRSTGLIALRVLPPHG
jgi:hypothetical protein